MNFSELNINNIRDTIGDIRTIKVEENTIKDLYISFDESSKKKLATLLTTRNVTRENQNLFIDSLIVKSEYEEALTSGQSPWIKTPTGYALTTRTIVHPRFSGNFKTLTTSKSDQSMFYAIDFYFDNFSFDFSNSRKELKDDVVKFENVTMTIYPGTISAKILED